MKTLITIAAVIFTLSSSKTRSNSELENIECKSKLHYEKAVGSCYGGYVFVPKNPEVGVHEDFCVMKYEAKIDRNGKDIDDG